MEYTEQENEKMQKMLLSPHFALGEFTKSGTAIKHGVDNTPHDIIVVVRLTTLCEKILEPLRKEFGAIRITSGYRCHLLNLQVGGVIGSQHELGRLQTSSSPAARCCSSTWNSSGRTATSTR